MADQPPPPAQRGISAGRSRAALTGIQPVVGGREVHAHDAGKQPVRARQPEASGAPQHAHKDAIERLVGRLVGIQLSPVQHESLQCYVYRLLGSRIGAPSVSGGGDEFALVEKMKRGLAASGAEGGRKAIRFAEVYRRFSHKRVVSNRAGVLHLLHLLTDSSPLAAAHARGSAPGTGSTLGLLEQSAVFKPTPPPMPDLVTGLQQTLHEVEGDSAAAPPAARWRDHQAMRTDHEVPESLIVRDVVFAMQGIDGQFVKFDKTVDGYTVVKGSGVPAPTRDLVRRICETGWLYRKVSAAVQMMTKNKRAVGMVAQGLAAGLQAELSEYYRLVAVLQAQSTSDVRDIGDKLSAHPSVGHPAPRAAAAAVEPQPLTLRRLLVWVQEPIARLKVMALLSEAAIGRSGPTTSSATAEPGAAAPTVMLKGGQLVTAMCAHARHGDPAVQSIMLRILKPVCSPVLAHIR